MDEAHLSPVPREDKVRMDGYHDHDSRRTSRTQRHSHETGESSATGSLGDNNSNGHSRLSTDTSRGGTYHGDSIAQLPSSEVRSRRKGRQASSNAFLLHDAVATAQERTSHRHTRNSTQQRVKAIPQTPEKGRLSTSSGKTASLSPDGPPRSAGQASMASIEDMSRRAHLQETFDHNAEDNVPSSPQTEALDVDSTQIVNMALNLSESRRIASTRRNVSRTQPPGLAPLPDASQGGSLRQHLQQQRRTSRGGSPRPPQHQSSPRIPYGPARTNSPLQSSGFENSHESSYRWHFTPSTLSRAQKAKEQLELMAQYRRLLEQLPPLTPEHSRNLTSPPSTPTNGVKGVKFGAQRSTTSQGRPYNPLQYIRNRKVRARERKVIDGESQGFGDVDAVVTWVDSITEQCSSTSSLGISQTSSHMPAFPSAADSDTQSSLESAAKSAARTRRPRVDWFFDPCDMIADAYWLEQGHHKELIEDRHRRKIFQPGPEIARPLSRQADDTNAGITPYSIKTLDEETDPIPAEAAVAKPDSELGQVKTREKAKQKLHDFAGFHHRHTSSLHGPQDVLKLRKASFSDLSESDTEAKDGSKPVPRRARAGTLSSDPNDLLQKQMIEILAKEARENQAADVPETVVEQDEPAEDVAFDQSSSSKPVSRSHSRKGSAADALESGKPPRRGVKPSPHHHRIGKLSLDLHDRLRNYSTDDDSSAPVSPQQEKYEHGILSVGNATLSPPWSRDGSPVRHRIIKTVTSGHDKRSQNAGNTSTDDNGDKEAHPGPLHEPPSLEDGSVLADARQASPPRKVNHVTTSDSHKSHRSTNSLRLREEQAVGLRGIFKGPRIDTVLRGGVSRIGDMLWRKDSQNETPPEAESTDESEGEVSRGRLRPALSRQTSKRKGIRRQTSKHFFDAMPQFHPIADTYNHARTESTSQPDLQRPEVSRTHSRQSSHADLLKPPGLDSRGHSPSVSPPALREGQHPSESDVSDATSSQQRISAGVLAADRRLSSIMGLSQFPSGSTGRANSQMWLENRRHSSTRPHLSKREVARMNALILSSGIKAMELSRRARSENVPLDSTLEPTEPSSIPWTAIAKLSPDPAELYSKPHARCDLYPLAARHLTSTIQTSAQRWQSSAERFNSSTAPTLHRRLGTLRSRVADDLSERTRDAADLADETSKDLALTQPLKVKHVQDLVEGLMRRRRRRFRWTRRAMWLGVEWVLVGFMWYVWFVVTILRLFLGVGKAAVAGVRWLLWL